ncbi:MAG: hypothetical protein U1F26_09995 [Lysobacterales bacterium]
MRGWWIGLLLAMQADAAQVMVSECRGPAGERMFVAAARCPDGAPELQRRAVVTADVAPPPPAPVERAAPNRHRGGGGSHQRAEAVSFRCSIGAEVWYQHVPCRNDARHAGGNKNRGGKNAPGIRQTRVPRSTACREIARPAAVLRQGSRRDERAGPYARATGRDPCG